MNDRLEQAVALLKEKQVSCVIWIEGKEPILSDEIGIKPLMKELRKERHAFEHGVIADKVIGKAAALMAILGGAKAVYGQVLSESAEKILQIYGIEYAYEEKVPTLKTAQKRDNVHWKSRWFLWMIQKKHLKCWRKRLQD